MQAPVQRLVRTDAARARPAGPPGAARLLPPSEPAAAPPPASRAGGLDPARGQSSSMHRSWGRGPGQNVPPRVAQHLNYGPALEDPFL